MHRKKTAGIDGKTALTFEQRFQLSEKLKTECNDWKHQGLREIPIPKKDGKTRILKVPTIADRAYQCLVKYALEPTCALQPFTPRATGLGQDARLMMPKKSCSST